MSGLYSSLNSSIRAITAHSRAIETAGKNLANVNNPGYARQRIIYGDRGTVVTPDGAQSLGLEALGVQQLRDTLLDRQVLRETALSASFTAEQSGYQRAQAGLGQNITRTNSAADATTSGSDGLAATIDAFFNAAQDFASRPTEIGERQAFVQQATILTDRFQLTDQRLAEGQADLNVQIENDVTDANSLLTALADLNAQISRFEVGVPGSAVDLRDQRQARLEELAGKLAFDVKDHAGQLQLVTRDNAGAEVVLLDHATVNGPLAFDGTQITAGTPAVALTLGGGSIKGALSARDGAIQSLRTELDQLARQLVTSVNATYNPTGTTGDFFTPTGTSAGTLQLDPGLTAANLKASDGGAAGDNTIARALAALAEQTFSTGAGAHIDGTFAGFFRQSVTKLGQALAGANARVDDQENIAKLVRSQRDAVSGVSLDEEMADLMKYQRAFQASSRVFNVLDELLDLVVSRLGVG